MEVAVACDMDGERALASMSQAGYSIEDLTLTDRCSEANDAIRNSRSVVTSDSNIAIVSDVDVIVEATGNPELGTLHAVRAIEAQRHIVMVNVEADVLTGPTLKRMADDNGVVYSLAYGDQPAIIEEMYDWAASLGFDVIAAGKWTRYMARYRKGTPEEALSIYGHLPGEITEKRLNPQMYNSFLDGTKSAIEMCAVANMTGLVPDIPGMHFPPCGLKDLPRVLSPIENGGILTQSGVVEVVSCIDESGKDIPDALRWGVFVVLTSDSAYLKSCLKDYGVAMDPSGTYAAMYLPYHLVGMEAPVSIARAYLRGEPTGAPMGRVGEVAAVAKRPLNTGDVLDGEGGHTVYGQLITSSHARSRNVLPIGLCHNVKIVKSVEEDQVLSLDDVEIVATNLSKQLRQEHP